MDDFGKYGRPELLHSQQLYKRRGDYPKDNGYSTAGIAIFQFNNTIIENNILNDTEIAAIRHSQAKDSEVSGTFNTIERNNIIISVRDKITITAAPIMNSYSKNHMFYVYNNDFFNNYDAFDGAEYYTWNNFAVNHEFADSMYHLRADSPLIGTSYNGADIGAYGVGSEEMGLIDLPDTTEPNTDLDNATYEEPNHDLDNDTAEDVDNSTSDYVDNSTTEYIDNSTTEHHRSSHNKGIGLQWIKYKCKALHGPQYNEGSESGTTETNDKFHRNKYKSWTNSGLQMVIYENKKRELGQVLTSSSVAKIMSYLILEDIKKSSRILDPCIGKNVFFKTIEELGKQPYMTGIEYDDEMINDEITSFFLNRKRTLLTQSFFNLSLEEKFDFIIQNPPYVRQELLTKGENSKDKIYESLNLFGSRIPKKSNLYVYFILKSILHLNENGKMIAVFYDSWLYSIFGYEFKKILLEYGSLRKIIHLKHDAFEDVDVGATIIEFVKTKNHLPIQYYSLNSSQEIQDFTNLHSLPYEKMSLDDILHQKLIDKSGFDFSSEFFMDIGEISSIPLLRGTSALINKYFLFKDESFDETLRIIKNVSSIKSMSVTDEYVNLLYIKENLSINTEKYLNHIEDEICLTPNKYKSIKAKIKKDTKSWYKITLKPKGNVIFNYYLRDNIDFIMNENLYAASDNFYTLNIEKDLLENFSILNSSFTKMSILDNSRSQGKGLYKIQLYDFKKVRIVNVDKLSTDSRIKLKQLGIQLAKSSRFTKKKEDLIDAIDSILLDEFNKYNNSNTTKDFLANSINKIKDGF